MENLIEDNSVFKITNFEIDGFKGIYLDADYRLSTGDMCYLPLKNQLVFSLNNYKDTSDIASHLDEIEKYKDEFCYLKMDIENFNTSCLVEDEGVPYDLFEGPDYKAWCMMGYTKAASNSKDVCLPLDNRNDIKECKEMRSVGEHIFAQGERVLAYTDKTFNNKPTKIAEYKFSKDGLFKSIKRTKIDEPQIIKCIHNEEGVHAFSSLGENKILHRLLDYKGVEIKRRELSARGIFLDASFEKNSYLIEAHDYEETVGDEINGMNFYVKKPSEIFYEEYACNGSKVEEVKLFELNELCAVRSIWSDKINDDTYVVNMVYGNDEGPVKVGNGWFVVSKGALKECWLQNREMNGYNDLVSGKSILFDMENITIDKVKPCGNGYAVYFDGLRDKQYRNRAAVIVNTFE